MKRVYFCLGLILYFNFGKLFAQNKYVKGVVISQKDAKPIAYATILETSTFRGVQTDSLGNFEFTLSTSTEILKATNLGYKKLELKVEENSFVVFRLEENEKTLDEVTIKPEENPAWKIMRKVLENIDINDPTKYKNIQADYYSKASLEPYGKTLYKKKNDTLPLKNVEGKLFVVESYGNYYRSQRQFKSVITKSISSFPGDYPVNMLINYSQNPYCFYDQNITVNLALLFNATNSQNNLGTRSYLNPVSKNTFKNYRLTLRDTLINSSTDTTFTITFEPLPNLGKNGLTGTLKINSQQYAIEEISASSIDSTSAVLLNFYQKYTFVNSRWYPTTTTFQTLLPVKSKKLDIDLKYNIEEYYSNISNEKINTSRIFDGSQRQLLTTVDTLIRSDFDDLRTVELDSSEIVLYKKAEKVDSSYLFEKYLTPAIKILTAVTAGGINYKGLTFLFNNTDYNNYEKLRVSLGFQNSLINNPRFKVYGMLAYGTADRAFKYETSLAYHITRDRYNKIEAYSYKLLQRPGLNPQLFANYNIQPALSLNLGIDSFWLDSKHVNGLALYLKPMAWTQIKLYAQTENRQALNYNITDESNNNVTQQFGFSLRYAYRETINRVGNLDAVTNGFFPIIRINYTSYFPENKNFNTFQKTNVEITQQFRSAKIGKTNLNISAGNSWGHVPFQFLFNNLSTPFSVFTSRAGQGFVGLSSVGLGYRQYVSFGFIQDFEKRLIKSSLRFMQPQIQLYGRMAIGKLNGAVYKINDKPIRDFAKGSYESGIILNNLFIIKILGVKVGLGATSNYNFTPDNLKFGKWTFFPNFQIVLF